MTAPVDVVVSVSGGLSSYFAIEAAAERWPRARLTSVFADVNFEDEDTMRVVWLGAEAVTTAGGRFHVINDGRDPFDVYDDVKFLGNTRIDPCSKLLKREPIKTWLKAEFDPASTVLVLGFGIDEEHRLGRCRTYYEPLTVAAPLVDRPLFDAVATFKARHGFVPELYRLGGYSHSNCGGFCCKAGIRQMAKLLDDRPERYAIAEAREAAFRTRHGDFAFLRDRTGGETRPLTLAELRRRIEAERHQVPSLFDVLPTPGVVDELAVADGEEGACSCMDPILDEDAA